jgi:hypothetical protein
MWSAEACETPGMLNVGSAGSLIASFNFGGRTGLHSYPSVSPAQRLKFQHDFSQQLAAVQAELAGCRDRDNVEWLPAQSPLPPRLTRGPYRPRSDFHVFVSEAYRKSRALVPAWLGQRGWIEFPAHRVVAGEAPIAHEIVHVLFPNGNRMLAEGLAVYLQDKLFPNVAVYPNFGDRLETVVADFLRATFRNEAPQALWDMNLEGLERISTPDKLCLRIGRDVLIGAKPQGPEPPASEVRTIYAVAGSFVEFLLENLIADDLLTEANFGTLYKATPLLPLERDSGHPERWRDCYDATGRSYSFAELALLWKTYMHFVVFGMAWKAGARSNPIPRKFAKIPLVEQLYEKLNDLTGAPQEPPSPAARPRRHSPARQVANHSRGRKGAGAARRHRSVSQPQPNQ